MDRPWLNPPVPTPFREVALKLLLEAQAVLGKTGCQSGSRQSGRRRDWGYRVVSIKDVPLEPVGGDRGTMGLSFRVGRDVLMVGGIKFISRAGR